MGTRAFWGGVNGLRNLQGDLRALWLPQGLNEVTAEEKAKESTFTNERYSGCSALRQVQGCCWFIRRGRGRWRWQDHPFLCFPHVSASDVAVISRWSQKGEPLGTAPAPALGCLLAALQPSPLLLCLFSRHAWQSVPTFPEAHPPLIYSPGPFPSAHKCAAQFLVFKKPPVAP